MTDLEGRTKDLIIRSDWRHPVASVLRKKLRVTSFRARTCRHPDQIRRRPDETGNERVWNRLLERNRWKLANEKKKKEKRTSCVYLFESIIIAYTLCTRESSLYQKLVGGFGITHLTVHGSRYNESIYIALDSD